MDEANETKYRERQFLEPEHWRQLVPFVATVLIPLLIFLGILWADHGQLSNNTATITVLSAQVAELKEKDILLEAHLTADEQILNKIGTQMESLGTSVSSLTLAVQKLTDLLPEKRR